MKQLSNIFSIIFSPLLVPTYAMALTLFFSILFIVPTASKLGVIAMTFCITCLVPLVAILCLYKLKLISDPGLNNRQERFVPYTITLFSYAGLAFYLFRIHSPAWLVAFPFGAVAAVVISIIVSLKWKISAHGAAIGGLVGLIFGLIYYNLSVTPLMQTILYVSILVAGAVGTSRVYLQRHTVSQVIAGMANGFICVISAIYLYH